MSCHLSVHPSGRFVLAATYREGKITTHPINDDDTLGPAADFVVHSGAGPHPQRQDGPHTHMVVTDPASGDGRGHVLVADLGNDTVYRYDLDVETGKLAAADSVALPPGTGPRHLVVNGQYAYVVGELTSTLSVVDLAVSPPRVLTTVTTNPDDGPEPSLPSAIRLSPDGTRIYIANRGPNTIATFAVDGPDVRLLATSDSGVDYPWDILLDGDHMYVVGQRSCQLQALAIDHESGKVQTAGTPLDVPYPVCILPAP